MRTLRHAEWTGGDRSKMAEVLALAQASTGRHGRIMEPAGMPGRPWLRCKLLPAPAILPPALALTLLSALVLFGATPQDSVLAASPSQTGPLPGAAQTPGEAGEDEWGERVDGDYYTLVDERGRYLTYTSFILGEGDSYLDSTNRRYEVTAVEGDIVRTRYVEKVKLPRITTAFSQRPAVRVLAAAWKRALGGGDPQAGPPKDSLTIGIYHSHSDESYVPSSGTEAKQWGDIYKVGSALKDSLESMGYRVLWSRNNHNPHDGQAYARSRRTVAQLLRTSAGPPSTLIDVHRDAVPPEVYRTSVKGQDVVKVRLVVGRQNQNREANLEYAKRLKAAADKELPGIIEGIFSAQGNYNQDLGPRMMLLEFGAHTNTLEEALRSAKLFSKVIPIAVGVGPGGGAGSGRLGKVAGRSALWLAVAAVVVALGFFAFNLRSLRGLGQKLRREVKEEIGKQETGPVKTEVTEGGPAETYDAPPEGGITEESGAPGGEKPSEP